MFILRRFSGSSLSVIALAMAAPVSAQDSLPQDPAGPVSGSDDDDAIINEIVVTARSTRGAVEAPQPPILELGPEEIAAYGAGSIEELLTAIGPMTNSGRGRGSGGPAILVNGARISSFREMRSYPPEAIERVEVFPEEVALRYGFSADQRVINFILKDNFSSRELELEYGQPFDGGYSSKQVEATYLLINGPTRYNVNLEWEDASLLTEAERGVVQAATGAPTLATDPDPARYRSLSSDSAGLEATGNLTTRLSENGASLSVNATFERDNTLRYQGLNTITLTSPDDESLSRSFNPNDPLTVKRRTETYALGSTLNAPLGDWQLTATVDGSRSESRSLIARRLTADNSPAYAALLEAARDGSLAIDADIGTLASAGYDEANTRTDTANSLVTLTGRPLYLPGGEVSVTVDGGFNYTSIRSNDTRNSGVSTRLKRGDLSAGVNVAVPITSVRDDFGAAIGDLNFNASAGINHLSDFGTLTDWTVGLTWSPWEPLSLSASYIVADSAPTLSQLGDPEVATPNEPIFDLVRGETVLTTTITGGNPNLPEQRQRDWKIGAMLQLPFLERSNFSIDYFHNRSSNVAAGFPVLTPEVEAAFPGRVIRDADGRLLQVDQRPVTFASQKSDRLQFGLNLSGPLGAKPVESASGGGESAGRVPGGSMPVGGQAAPAAPSRLAPPAGAEGAGQGGRSFDPERMARMREQFCSAEEPPELTPEILARLPEQLQQRLRGEDGQVDPERYARFRERVCSENGPRGPREGAGQDGTGQDGTGQDGGAPRGGFMAGGPGEGQGGPGGPGAGNGGGAPGGVAGAGRAGPGAGGMRGPGGPAMGGPGGGSGQGRWMANLQYTLEMNNKILVAPGGPVLDLLNGDALTGGGQPRHSATLRGGVFYHGYGGFANVTYTGSSRLNGASDDLRFNDLLTFNLRVFADLNQRASLIESAPIFKNTRISFSVDNIFDAQQRVTDASGEVPLRYQPALLDPVGRYFEVELRKLF